MVREHEDENKVQGNQKLQVQHFNIENDIYSLAFASLIDADLINEACLS